MGDNGRGFVQWQAFKDDEYQFSDEQGDYFLWVGGYDGEKGLPQFQQMAIDFPDHKFVVYGRSDPHVVERMPKFMKEHPNFEFRGELLRGKPHHEAFKNARAFFFWTHMWGETF